ncbi:hypothetical protein ACFQ2B_38395 [Streptomyces stramineus]
MLEEFGVRVGVRRLVDAAACLDALGLTDAAAIADHQARTLGSLQLPLATRDDRALAAGLRRLAPLYERLRAALAAAVGDGTAAADGGHGRGASREAPATMPTRHVPAEADPRTGRSCPAGDRCPRVPRAARCGEAGAQNNPGVPARRSL